MLTFLRFFHSAETEDRPWHCPGFRRGTVPCGGHGHGVFLSSGLPLAGSLAMVAMALGMGITTWLFAVMAIACRDSIRRICHGPNLQRVSDILSVCSGFMLLALGGLMLLA